MTAIVNPVEDLIAIDGRRRWQLASPDFVAIGYQLGVVIRAVSCSIKRHFTTFAGIH
jgi:hypothetical protein